MQKAPTISKRGWGFFILMKKRKNKKQVKLNTKIKQFGKNREFY